MSRTESGWKCHKCDLVVKTLYSIKRHIARMHKEEENIRVVETNSNLNVTNSDGTVSDDMESLLKDAGLETLLGKFEKEGTYLKLLMELDRDDMRRMMADLDINWGARYKIEKQVDKVKDRYQLETHLIT